MMPLYHFVICLSFVTGLITAIHVCTRTSSLMSRFCLSGEDKRMSSEELQKMYDKMSSKDRKLEDMIKENEELREQMAKIKQQNIAES